MSLSLTRERRVKLSGQVLRSELIHDGIYLFTENPLEERRAAIESIHGELSIIVKRWLESYTPINQIQEALEAYLVRVHGEICKGSQYDFSQNLDYLQAHPDTLVVDCTGYDSILRERIRSDNRIGRVLEFALICTFTLDDRYPCNE